MNGQSGAKAGYWKMYIDHAHVKLVEFSRKSNNGWVKLDRKRTEIIKRGLMFIALFFFQKHLLECFLRENT